MPLHTIRKGWPRLFKQLANQVKGPKLANEKTVGRTIVSLASYGGVHPERPEPFNYRTTSYSKGFSFGRLPYSLSRLEEKTVWRMNQNSRVIVVDGPVASNKHVFAEELARQLDFFYAPQSPVEHLWYNDYYKFYEFEMDDVLETDMQIYTPARWHADSHSRPADLDGYQGRVGGLQLDYLNTRVHTYSDSMLHLLSTGQGVVIVRSPWSDYAFAKALKEGGYFNNEGWAHYERSYRNKVADNPRPHVYIYIDNPVPNIVENIKKRARPGESTSGKINEQFLKCVEETYHERVMPVFKEHGEVLIYNYTPDITEQYISLVAEDVEGLGELTTSMVYGNDYLEDWLNFDSEAWTSDKRSECESVDYREQLLHMLGDPYMAPGMVMSMEDCGERKAILKQIPGFRFAPGYDKDLDGWKGALFGPDVQGDIRKFYIPRSKLFDNAEVVPRTLHRYIV